MDAQPVTSDGGDAALLANLARDDDAALAALFRTHAPAVHAYARSMVHRGEDAQEVVQSTFITLWEKRATLETFVGTPLPWLLATARNHARNLLRTRMRAEARDRPLDGLDLLDADSDPHRAAAAAEDGRVLRAALDELAPLERRIFALCVEEDLPYKQAAARLGLSRGSVRNRLSRARRGLRARLDGDWRVSDD